MLMMPVFGVGVERVMFIVITTVPVVSLVVVPFVVPAMLILDRDVIIIVMVMMLAARDVREANDRSSYPHA
jgi:hypothetical protein